MALLSRFALAITIFMSTSLASLGFRTDNKLMGFLFVVIAFVAIVYIARVLWNIIGFMMTVFLVIAFLLLVLYLTGAFSGGTGVVPERAISWLKQEKKPADSGKQVIYGPAAALSGDSINIMGQALSLYGIAAPKMDQVCSDGTTGRAYMCGEMAKTHLNKLLADKEPVCILLDKAPVSSIGKPAICNIGEYDLGALQVVEGWAIPDRMGGAAYVPYERKAIELKHGMWTGSFLAPWEWEKSKINQERRKRTIKIPEPANSTNKIRVRDYWLK